MIVTPLKLIRLPTRTRSARVELQWGHFQQAEDFAAWLHGEDTCATFVGLMLQGIPTDYRKALKLPERPPINERVKVVCKDGELDYSKARLRRHYHFFDDYFSEFPNEESVEVPFDKEVVANVVSCSGVLLESYECLSYFNPKEALTYFQFDTTGSDPDLLSLLVSRLADKDRKNILEARRANGKNYPLPEEGVGIGILGYILEEHNDIASLHHFFSKYPSYLTFADSHNRAALLLTAEYNSREYWNEKGSSQQWLSGFFTQVFMSKDFKTATEDVRRGYSKRVLAMLGVRHKTFDNVELDVIPPYHIDTRDFLQALVAANTINYSISFLKLASPGKTEEECKKVLEDLAVQFRPIPMAN